MISTRSGDAQSGTCMIVRGWSARSFWIDEPPLPREKERGDRLATLDLLHTDHRSRIARSHQYPYFDSDGRGVRITAVAVHPSIVIIRLIATRHTNTIIIVIIRCLTIIIIGRCHLVCVQEAEEEEAEKGKNGSG